MRKIEIAALIIIAISSCCYYVYSIFSEKSESEKKLMTDGVKYKPKIVLEKEPQITGVEGNLTDPVLYENLINGIISEIDIALNITFTLYIKNDGVTNARITSIVQTDKRSKRDNLRKILLNPNNKEKIILKEIDPDYDALDLDPEETISIGLKHAIGDLLKVDEISEDGTIDNIREFIIHVMVFYENDLGNLYDTYFWIICKAHRFKLESGFFYPESGVLRIQGDMKDLNKWIKIVDTQTSTHLYNLEEKEILDKYFERLKQQINPDEN